MEGSSIWIAAVLLTCACSSPAADGLPCTVDGICPDGQTCYDGICRLQPPVDAATPVDGAITDGGATLDAVTVDGGPEATLEVLRAEIPCLPTGCAGNIGCVSEGGEAVLETFVANRDQAWDVTLRIRGVVELSTYVDGVADGYWVEGGTVDNPGVNVAQLKVSDPDQTFHLNSGSATNTVALDYQRTITVNPNAALTLSFGDPDNCTLLNSDGADPIVIPDIPPAPSAFDGQFVQIDVVAATPQP